MDAFLNFFSSVGDSYNTFFSLDAFQTIITDPSSWAVIGSLIILEGLLSADNALVLAVMVNHLPKKQQKKALFYGIFGAYIFRFLAIGIGVYLVKFWLIKIAGGLYLLWLTFKYFKDKQDEGEEEGNGKKRQLSFWRTVLLVELMDIAFSLDSVIAAFGVSNKVWVLFMGGILGVLMMRSVAGVFLKLLEKIPEFETTAFVLIAIIGIKMLVGVFGVHLPEIYFFILLIAVFLATFVVHYAKGAKPVDSKSHQA